MKTEPLREEQGTKKDVNAMKETKQHRRKLQRKNELSEDKVVIRVWVRGVKSFETKYHTLNIKQDARNMLTAFVRLGI
jgi:hypothetical protein